MTLGAALLLALVGVLVGAVGLGGFLVVPTLVWLTGQDPADSVAAAALAFLAAGVVSALAPSSRRGTGTAPPGLTPGAGRAYTPPSRVGALDSPAGTTRPRRMVRPGPLARRKVGCAPDL